MKKLTLKQLREVAYPMNHSFPPTQEELEAKGLYFYRTCRPKEYREMRKDGTLQEVCRLKAEAAKSYTERITSDYYPAPVAWNMAIRQEILESETD